jgi:hypothetical protein
MGVPDYKTLITKLINKYNKKVEKWNKKKEKHRTLTKWDNEKLRKLLSKVIPEQSPTIRNGPKRRARQATGSEWANNDTLGILAEHFDVCIYIYNVKKNTWRHLGYICEPEKIMFLWANGVHFQNLWLKIKGSIDTSDKKKCKYLMSTIIAAIDALNTIDSKEEYDNFSNDIYDLFKLKDVPSDGSCGYHAFANAINKINSNRNS